MQFVSEDLFSAGVRLVPAGQDSLRILTDLAIYNVRIVSDAVGMIEGAHKRRPNDWIHGAEDVVHRLHLARNRASAEERVRNLGPGARRWRDFSERVRATGGTNDVPMWFALLLLEAFTLLREQFRLYPSKSFPRPTASRTWCGSHLAMIRYGTISAK